MRHAEDGRFHHAGLLVQQELDLLWIDVVAAGDDEVLGAADDGDVAVGALRGEVAGDEEAVRAEFLRSLFRHVPVALEDVAALDLDDAHLAGRHRPSRLGVRDAQVHAGQRQADGAGAALAVIRVGRVHVGFGHAVALEDSFARPCFERAMRFRQQRRRAGDEQAHMRGQLPIKARIGQQARVEGRHAHHRRRLRHRRDQVVHVEAGQEDNRAAGQQDRLGGDEQAARVENRQRVQKHVVAGEAPRFHKRLGVRKKIVMRQHGALRTAGRAGGVKESSEIVRPALGRDERIVLAGREVGQRAGPVAVQSQQRRPRFRRDRRKRPRAAAVADQQPGPGIGDEIVDFGRCIGGVERQEGGAGGHAGGIDGERLRRFLRLQRNPVADRDAAGAQRIGKARSQPQELSVADIAPVLQPQERIFPALMRREKRVMGRVGQNVLRAETTVHP